jgi:hypothetical protein
VEVKIASMIVGSAKNARALLWVLPVCAAITAGTPGCEDPNEARPTPRFTTDWSEARQSLDATLSAWRDAPASAPVPSSFTTPSIQFIDRERRPGQRLLSYQILAQSDYENARQFTVRLNLEGEGSPQLVKYNILGSKPVWIFRLEDYEKFSHWEHDMSETAGSAEESTEAGRPTPTK